MKTFNQYVEQRELNELWLADKIRDMWKPDVPMVVINRNLEKIYINPEKADSTHDYNSWNELISSFERLKIPEIDTQVQILRAALNPQAQTELHLKLPPLGKGGFRPQVLVFEFHPKGLSEWNPQIYENYKKRWGQLSVVGETTYYENIKPVKVILYGIKMKNPSEGVVNFPKSI
jgi:hypothetical protein